jgi:hypothetical protein
MLRPPAVRHAFRHLALAPASVKDQAHLSKFETTRRDPIYRPAEVLAEFGIRQIWEKPETVENLFLLSTEILSHMGVSPEGSVLHRGIYYLRLTFAFMGFQWLVSKWLSYFPLGLNGPIWGRNMF